jgi:hypothetical protein
VTTIELSNPSAFHPLRVYTQDRARNAVDKVPAAKPALPKRETRAELEKRGAEILMRPFRGQVREGGVLRAVTRDIPTPRWQDEGFYSLSEFVTQHEERQAQAARVAAAGAVPVQRTLDEWLAPKAFESVPPHGKITLPAEDHRRYLIECDDEPSGVTLQIANQSTTRTMRLRIRDVKSGEVSHVAFIAPAREYPQAACVTAGNASAAVVELMPS